MTPIPEDFPLYYQDSTGSIQKRYSVNDRTVKKWRDVFGWTYDPSVRRKKAPDGFATSQQGVPVRELQKIYGVSGAVITRWLREAGINRAQSRRRKPSKAPVKTNSYMTAPVDRPYREDTAAGSAQAYLQTDRPVYRLGRNLWQCGALKLTDAELVAKAAEVCGRRERLVGRVA